MQRIAIIGIVTHPFFYFFWRSYNQPEYDSLPMRLLGSLIILPGVFPNQLERYGGNLIPLTVWSLAIGYNLPFFFSYMLLQNANLESEIASNFYSWPMQYAVALMLLVMLVVDGLMVSIIFLVATLAAWVLFYFTNDQINYAAITDVYFVFLPTFLFILVTGSIFNRNREIIQQEKLAAMASVGSNIAHELRTPLLGIKATARGLSAHLPALVKGYDLAVKNGLTNSSIRARHLSLIRKSLRHIEAETDQSNSVIDMLLINSTQNPLQGLDFESFSIKSCLEEVLERYPFDDERQENLVVLNTETDFIVWAPRILIVHVMFNLLKNGLYYVRKANKGSITIQTQISQGIQQVIVEDTGTGVDPQHIPHIFERFYTTTQTGTGSGIGLTFCKLVMNGLGGDIRCSSIPDRYTRFTLNFKT